MSPRHGVDLTMTARRRWLVSSSHLQAAVAVVKYRVNGGLLLARQVEMALSVNSNNNNRTKLSLGTRTTHTCLNPILPMDEPPLANIRQIPMLHITRNRLSRSPHAEADGYS